MAIMSHLQNCPAAWVDHLLQLAQYNLLASGLRILFTLPLESPRFSMALFLPHLGVDGLSVQPRSDH